MLPASNMLLFTLFITMFLNILITANFDVHQKIQNYIIDVEFENNSNYIEHFWESTGLCPPEPYRNASDYLLSSDMNLNLALIGSLPRRNLFQVRIHWLLNLIKVRNFKNKTPIYDFAQLDKLLNTLKKYYLKPGFELMGNPSGIFTDFENKTQIFQWRDLIKMIAKRYIAKFGIDYVRQWNFESWNEPDHKDFDNLNFTLQGFMNYYDACSEGLKMADTLLKFGGPAESFRGKFTYFCYNLLAHCSSGTNYFTGEKGVRLDFISMHKKGNLTSISILEEELATIEDIKSMFPKFKNIQFYNDEADPLVGWWKPQTWRADATYAAMVIKVIGQHLNFLLLKANNSINYSLLSNDNGFLNMFPQFFEQRTLLTRFGNSYNQSIASNVIRKPVYIATGLLNYLGENYAKIKINGCLAEQLVNNSQFGVFAAHHTSTLKNKNKNFDFGLIIYNSEDMTFQEVNFNLTLNINISGIIKNENKTDKDIFWVWYKLDNYLSNSYQTWKNLGNPIQPDNIQLQLIRAQEGPFRQNVPQPKMSKNGIYTFQNQLSQPGIAVLHACCRPSAAPRKVTNLQIHCAVKGDSLLTWNTVKLNKCIRTFDVQFSLNITGPYRQLNSNDIIFPSFSIPVSKITQRGYYRVRAVDYWNRSGKWSSKFGQCPGYNIMS